MPRLCIWWNCWSVLTKQRGERTEHEKNSPLISEGKLYLHQFDVDDPIPVVEIPLNADDVLKFDFGAPYHKTVQEALFAYEFANYNELPVNFDRYRERDQARIAARMLAVLEAACAGIDLETGPFPIKEITLEAALAQIETLKQAEI